MSYKTLGLIFATAILGACSTVQAANKTGETVENAAACQSSSCLKTLRTSEVIESTKLANGDTKYLIRMQRRQGSFLRALTYGTAAVFTLGLSEALTTPLEGALQNDKQLAVEAVCNTEDYCHRLVIAQLNQPTVYVRGITPEEQAAVDAAKTTS